MATKKKEVKQKSWDGDWEHDDEKYPRKRDVCDHCGQRDDLKLSFDQIHWICVNAHACVLRWQKSRSSPE